MKYNIILADPPWEWKPWKKVAWNTRAVENHYSTMTTEDICRLQIPAADDSVLFIWATYPKLKDALQVIEAWGFEYKTQAWTWIKSNPTGFGFFMGLGYYTRANTEVCLLATRGNPRRPQDKGILSLIYSPVMQHSRKPIDQFRKIEALYPAALYPNRLELFARRRQPGWTVFGNQVPGGSDIILETAA